MASAAATEWRFVFSRDGSSIDRHGAARAAELPKADRVVLVVDECDVSWLRARLPRVRSNRMQAVLRGTLEDDLLTDATATHLALGRASSDSEGSTWIAATDLGWLKAQLASLSEQGVEVDALVAATEPGTIAALHARMGASGGVEVVSSGADGVALCTLEDWARGRVGLREAAWTSEPQAAKSLADGYGIQAGLQSEDERLLQAALQGTNLMQFDLVPQARLSRLVAQGWAGFADRQWRAVHVGLMALVVVQLVGLNLSAWQTRRELAALEQRSAALLQATFASVKVVVDPGLQMQRELQALRDAKGQASATDLETWLDLLAPFWTRDMAPLNAVRLDAGRLVLESSQAEWPAPALEALRRHAATQGWTLHAEGSRLTLAPASSRERAS